MSKPAGAHNLRTLCDAYVVKHGPTCRVCALPAPVRREAEALVAEHRLKSAVAAGLRQLGHAGITNGVFNRHFRDGHERG